MPTRSLAMATLIALAPALAHADPGPATTTTAPGDTPTQAAAAHARRVELASIDAESHAATALYVASTALVVAGVAVGVRAIQSAFSCSFGSWGPGASGCGSESSRVGTWIAASVVLGLGVLALPIAIGLDVDSGSRRGRLESRATIDRVQLTPTEGGAYLSLGGRF